MKLRFSAALIVALVGIAPARAQGTDWSAAVGIDVMSGRYSQGAATSLSFDRRLGSLGGIGDFDLAVGWFRGSGDYSPFNCHLARQIYCFGGAERLTGMNVGLLVTGEAMGRILGLDVIPVASVGIDRSKSEVSETEGPTTFCFIDGEIVSCPDNPPFSQFTDVERSVLPFYSFGLDFSRRIGRVTMRAGLATYRAEWIGDQGHGRVGFKLGLGF